LVFFCLLFFLLLSSFFSFGVGLGAYSDFFPFPFGVGLAACRSEGKWMIEEKERRGGGVRQDRKKLDDRGEGETKVKTEV
jgi:hypothetical protein